MESFERKAWDPRDVKKTASDFLAIAEMLKPIPEMPGLAKKCEELATRIIDFVKQGDYMHKQHFGSGKKIKPGEEAEANAEDIKKAEAIAAKIKSLGAYYEAAAKSANAQKKVLQQYADTLMIASNITLEEAKKEEITQTKEEPNIVTPPAEAGLEVPPELNLSTPMGIPVQTSLRIDDSDISKLNKIPKTARQRWIRSYLTSLKQLEKEGMPKTAAMSQASKTAWSKVEE